MNLRKTIDSIEFLDAFMYIALFRLALSLENCPAIGGTSSLLPLTPERNCRYGVSKGTADMLSPHHKISFFSTLLYSVYTELGILPFSTPKFASVLPFFPLDTTRTKTNILG